MNALSTPELNDKATRLALKMADVLDRVIRARGLVDTDPTSAKGRALAARLDAVDPLFEEADRLCDLGMAAQVDGDLALETRAVDQLETTILAIEALFPVFTTPRKNEA